MKLHSFWSKANWSQDLWLSQNSGLVLCKFPQCKSFPEAEVLHKLIQCGSLPWGGLSEEIAPTSVPLRVTNPASKSVPAWGPLSMWPQALPRACSSFPQGHSILWHASSPAGRTVGGYQSHHGPPWAVGVTACLTKLQRKLFSATWSTSSPSFCMDLGDCSTVSLTHSHSSLVLQLPTTFFSPSY